MGYRSNKKSARAVEVTADAPSLGGIEVAEIIDDRGNSREGAGRAQDNIRIAPGERKYLSCRNSGEAGGRRRIDPRFEGHIRRKRHRLGTFKYPCHRVGRLPNRPARSKSRHRRNWRCFLPRYIAAIVPVLHQRQGDSIEAL